VDGRFVPLEYENGDRLRSKTTPRADVEAAYRRAHANMASQSHPMRNRKRKSELARREALSIQQALPLG
jgi:hypothetical protein